MPKPSSSRAAQPHHRDFLRLAQLLKQPVNDGAAAAEMIKVAVEATKGQLEQIKTRSQISQQAAVLSSSVAAALQCAGWLVAAHRCNPLPGDDMWCALTVCVVFSDNVLHRLPSAAADILQALLQPRAGSHVPGFTTWVPLVAQGLVDSYAAMPSPVPSAMPAGAAAAEAFIGNMFFNTSNEIVRGALAERLLNVWVRCLLACKGSTATSSSSSSGRGRGRVEPWVHPSLLQLADMLMYPPPLRYRTPDLLVHGLLLAVANGAASPLAHPQLAAAAGVQADGAQVAAALQQRCWWRTLATCLTCLPGITAAAAAAGARHLPHHPSKFCPAYHLEQAYACKPLQGMPFADQTASASLVLHVLLVGQLWDVLPWQLQQLQQAAAPNDVRVTSAGASSAAAQGAASSSSVDGACGAGNNGGLGDSSEDTSSSSSSSGSQVLPSQQGASLLGNTRLGDDPKSWHMLMRIAGLEWPLLPDRDAGSNQQEEAVTLQQLQLAVSAMAHIDAAGAVSAALLLALLLQRADPGLRASFLAGPGGTALLAAAQYWGHCADLAGAPGQGAVPFLLFYTVESSEGSLASRLLSVLGRDSRGGASGWNTAAPLQSLWLLLSWCYLQPAAGWAVAPSCWGPFPQMRCLVMTPHHHTLLMCPGACRPECLALDSIPGEAFQFAPGCAPTPLLLGTLEALLRRSTCTDYGILLHRAVAFIHATVVWMAGAAGGSSGGPAAEACAVGSQEGSNRSSSGSSGSSSSSSSGSAATTSSNSSSNAAGAGQEPCKVAPSTIPCNDGTQTGMTSSTSPQSSSSSSSSSSTSTSDSAAVMRSLASLAVTLGALLRQTGWDAAKPGEQHTFDEALQTLAANVLPSCCLIASKLLYLATQQLQGCQARPALQLSAAAQQLAAVCGDLARGVILGLAQASNIARAREQVQAGGEIHPDDLALLTAMLYLQPSLELVSEQLDALQSVQPWWQQQPDGQPRTAAEADEHGADSSSSSSHEEPGIMESMNQLLELARQVEHTCRTRLQLVGCSHPRCTNLSGPSAEGLVAGRRGVRCGGCQVARYCSPACQKANWLQHRHVCRRLAAAAVAGVGAVLE